jgi:NAD+ synthase
MEEKRWEGKIVSFIRAYFRKAGKKAAVVGVSGGLDSAVALALCVRALGRRNVIAAFLPSKHTPAADLKDARFLARKLGARTASFGIEPIIRAFRWVAHKKIDRANVSARIRMAVLYMLARNSNGLVVGTGDKSEFLLGYFTKHGDGGADIFPLGGLYKTEARKLALRLGIPSAIANKPASPALWKGHTAEGELGFSYETADAILKGMERRTPLGMLEKKFGKKVVRAVLKRMKENAHKSLPTPACTI